jgi:hypothetical protein
MAILNNKFIIKSMPWHANMTEMNHLGAALAIKPSVFKGKFNQLFSTQLYSQNPLETLRSMGSVGTREEVNTQWEWEMKAANTRPLVVVENVEPVQAAYGKFGVPFKMKLDEDWYLPGDYIFPGTNDKKLQVRIQEKIGKRGNGYLYVVQTTGKGVSIPAKYLNPGQQWTKLFSKYEEAAEQSGSTQYALPVMLTNKMSRFRKTYKVTGDVNQQVLAIAIPDSSGGFHDSWIKYAEVEYWNQWYREKAIADWFGYQDDGDVLGANGRPINGGPGIQEMLASGHRWNTNFITGKGFEEYIMDIYYGRVEFGMRNVKCFTGEYGLLEAHRFMTDMMVRHGFTYYGANFNPTERVKSPYHENAYSYGFKFTQWRMPNGSTLEFIHNPLYDDKTLNFEIDPVTGYPIASMRYTFLDFTDGKNGNNIELVHKKNSFKNWYVAGGTTPYGPNVKGLGSHAGDYYEIHVQEQCGVHIQDVTRCGEIILTRS